MDIKKPVAHSQESVTGLNHQKFLNRIDSAESQSSP